MSNRSRRGRLPDDNGSPSLAGRKVLLCLLFFLGMGALFIRLFILMILHGDRYKILAQENRVRENNLAAPRGILYDRNGIPLVHNIPVFVAPDKTVSYERPPAHMDAQWVEEVTREYPYGQAFAHIVGYVGEISQEELNDPRNSMHQAGDVIGKMGVEEAQDRVVRGVDGKALTEMDALGKPVRRLGMKPAATGNNLTLTIDRDTQLVAAVALGELRGAVVASAPLTGELLTLYSSPSFDPNVLVRGQGETILHSADQPLFNRAISGQYPPGSTFKIITSVAGLESHSISRDTQYEDTGILRVGSFSFGNWYFSQYGKTEGSLNIVGALRRSNDIFFYHAAQATSIETLAGWAKAFGLGQPLGIDLSGELNGLMPDPAWRQQVKNESWYLGNTYHVAIGQGDVLATPLQVNAWANVIATGGKLCAPYVVGSKQSAASLRPELRPRGSKQQKCKDLHISKETIELVREGMKQACAPGGTGWPLFKFKAKSQKFKVDNVDFFEPTEGSESAALKEDGWVEIPVACKTGTAEFGHPENKTHAWLTAYAPIVNPQISVTVLVEEGGEGSTNAAPIAKKVLEAWFTR